MDAPLIIAILFAAGLGLLLLDIFLPSHGILTILSLGMLMYGVYRTFQISPGAGLISLGGLSVTVPSILYVAVKVWHRTPVGRRISPPNPVLTEQDRLPVEQLRQVLGMTGRTATPLRPVGMCVFGDGRFESVAESGMIGANVPVEAVRLADRTIVVRAVDAARQV